MSVKRRKLANGSYRYRAVITVAGRQVLGEHGWSDKVTAERDDLELKTRRLDGELNPSDDTLGSYLGGYVAGLLVVSSTGEPIRPTTAAKYRDNVRRITSKIGHLKLDTLRKAAVEGMRDELLRDGLQPSTVRDDLAFLGRALDQAVIDGRMPRNPAGAKVVRRPRGTAAPAPHIDADKARAILEAADGEPLLDVVVHLALVAGLRREEILGLRWSAVDLEAGTLEVREVYTVAGFAEPKTNAGVRSVMLPGRAVAALRRHRDRQAVRPIGDALVVSNAGNPYTPTSVSRAWRLFAESHGFAGIGLHDLRHGAAQMFVDAGVPLEAAMRMLGWSRAEMLRYYAPNLSADASRAAVRMLDAHLGAAK